ncbi:addiction module antitoxin [Sphingomonas sp.]|uniref:addiction module antitoxin n=1 Tax=Sphingomonas sp. TaxID=28214 RepID=UPI0035BBF723
MTIDLDGDLSRHVAAITDGDGWYANVEEYVRDLIRRDIEREQRAFETFKAELQEAFAEPESNYRHVTAENVVARNGLRD